MLDITVHFGANMLRVFLSLLSIISVLPGLLYLPSVSLPLLCPVLFLLIPYPSPVFALLWSLFYLKYSVLKLKYNYIIFLSSPLLIPCILTSLPLQFKTSLCNCYCYMYKGTDI